MSRREQKLIEFIARAGSIIDMRSPFAMPIILRAFKAAEGR